MAGLVLVPTQLELSAMESSLRAAANDDWRIELCGFGPIAAASRTAALIERLTPARVVLIGIAGSFGAAHRIGTAATFGQVHCWGVGVGSGSQYQSAAAAGFPQWAGERPIGQTIDLPSSATGNVLLTCCAASATEQEARQKRQAVPAATAEDMEGFGVALSCLIAEVPLTIIRGISNEVGNRNKGDWQIEAALAAAAELATQEILSLR